MSRSSTLQSYNGYHRMPFSSTPFAPGYLDAVRMRGSLHPVEITGGISPAFKPSYSSVPYEVGLGLPPTQQEQAKAEFTLRRQTQRHLSKLSGREKSYNRIINTASGLSPLTTPAIIRDLPLPHDNLAIIRRGIESLGKEVAKTGLPIPVQTTTRADNVKSPSEKVRLTEETTTEAPGPTPGASPQQGTPSTPPEPAGTEAEAQRETERAQALAQLNEQLRKERLAEQLERVAQESPKLIVSLEHLPELKAYFESLPEETQDRLLGYEKETTFIPPILEERRLPARMKKEIERVPELYDSMSKISPEKQREMLENLIDLDEAYDKPGSAFEIVAIGEDIGLKLGKKPIDAVQKQKRVDLLKDSYKLFQKARARGKKETFLEPLGPQHKQILNQAREKATDIQLSMAFGIYDDKKYNEDLIIMNKLMSEINSF